MKNSVDNFADSQRIVSHVSSHFSFIFAEKKKLLLVCINKLLRINLFSARKYFRIHGFNTNAFELYNVC